MKIAFATFVKTPGLTPLKTRLGATIGQDKAEAFYLKSIQACKTTFKQIQNQNKDIDFFWSVTEKKGQDNPLWSDFPRVLQGEGQLGERLNTVYKNLKDKGYNAVFLYGSDSPHVGPEVFFKAFEDIKNNDSVLGLTEDGGYYILGSKTNITEQEFNAISYSTETTGEETKALLKKKGTLKELPTTFDIDYKEDLDRLLGLYPNFLA